MKALMFQDKEQDASAETAVRSTKRRSSLQRLKESETDAFAYFQNNFAELPWTRRARPGIRQHDR